MKKNKLVLSLLILVMLIMATCSSVSIAEDTNSFSVAGNVLIKYTGSESIVEIPDNLGITKIDVFAFSGNKNITSVTIPNGVTSIAYGAFQGCSKLKSVSIPDSVSSIEAYAFVGTNIPQPIIINGGKILCYVPASYTSYTIPDSITSIGDGAFIGTGIRSITVQSNVTSIGKLAFIDCKDLTTIVLPDELTSIGQGAFNGTSIFTPVIINNGKTLVYVPEYYKVYDIPKGVITIGDGAFGTKLTSVTIPDTVTTIGCMSFGACSDLKNVIIPNSVKVIGEQAFYACGMNTVVIPESVESIGKRAFWICSKLKAVKIMNNKTIIAADAFEGCDKNLTIFAEEGSFAQDFAVHLGIKYSDIKNYSSADTKQEDVPKPLIIENPELKIIIGGKQIDSKSTPVNVQGKTFLPAIPLLTSLGVKNDSAHIDWNASEKSIRINYGSLRIVIKSDDANAYVNGTSSILNTAPFMYNDSLYVPVDFVCSILGKVEKDDPLSKSLSICDQALFNKVKGVIQKIKINQSSYHRAKFKVAYGIKNPDVTYGEIDRKNSIMHFFSPFDMFDHKENLEYYIKQNTVYFWSADRGYVGKTKEKHWGYSDIGSNMLSDSFNIPLNYSDFTSAGLSVSIDKKTGDTVLEGDIYLDEFYKRPVTYYDMAKYNNIKKAHTKLIFDTKTYFMKYGSMDITYLYSYKKTIEKDRITYSYSDYNSSKIKLPIDTLIKAHAENFHNTLIGSGFEYFQDYIVQ